MRNLFYLFISLISISLYSQDWKEMANNNNYNFYEVVDEAESYFEGRDKLKKGSGWKHYKRWAYENEPKFYPSGVRDSIDPYFTSKEFKKFLFNQQKSSTINNSWAELGPYYIEEVTGHYAVGLGRVEAFYVDPVEEDRIFLGSRSGGFWKTTNGGETWTNSTDFLIASGVNTIAVSPFNSQRILINVKNSHNGTTHGIYESLDGGNTWSITNFNPDNLGWGGLGTNSRIHKIMYHPTIEDLVFVGTSEGIYRSVDNFNTFSAAQVENIFNGSGSYDFIEFHPENENIIYLTSKNNYQNIYISFDKGINFLNSGLLTENSSPLKLSISNACGDCVYVASSDGVWKSENFGFSFSMVSNPEITNYGAFAVSDTDINYMLLGDIDTHMSNDGGQTFNQATFWSTGDENYAQDGKYVHADIRGSRSFNGDFWVNTDGFLCKSSDNGITWDIFEGQSIRENYCLGVSQSNNSRSIVGSQDNGTSIKGDTNWIEFYGADGMEGIIHPLNDDWMIGSAQFGGKIRTKDGGYSQHGINPDDFSGDWVTPLFYDPKDQMRIYTASDTLYRSDDFGTSWVALSNPFNNNVTNGAIANNNSNIIALSSNDDLKISYNGGLTFTSISSNLPGQFITDIAFDPNNDNNILVTYGTYFSDNNKVFLTTNSGASWQNITYNLGNMPIRTVVIDNDNDSTIYVGSEIGVYKKGMDSNAWELFNENLPNTTIMELEIVKGSNMLRAATWGRGLWECKLPNKQDYPSIVKTSISNQPTETTPKEGVDQFITSTIISNSDLSNVYVHWSAGLFENGVIQMINQSQNEWVSQDPIPNYPEGSKIYFKVFAETIDNLVTETFAFMYEVKANIYCTPSMNCDVLDGFQLFQLGDIFNESQCEGYGDFMNISTELFQNSTNELTVTTGYGDQYVKVWIDYNDDLEFTNEEIVVDDYILAPGQGPGSYTETINLVIPENALVGPHILRAKTNWAADVPDDPCSITTYGETEDYTVIIIESLMSLNENNLPLAPVIYPNPTDGKVTVDLKGTYKNISVKLNDVLGREIFTKFYNEAQELHFSVNESSGVYFLKIATENKKLVFRLIKN